MNLKNIINKGIKMDNKQTFLKNHIDTLAIIGVNIAIAAILITMWVSQSSRIDAANARSDALYSRIDTIQMIIYDMLKEGRK